MKSVDRLLIVSHVIHYEWKGRLYAYGPYSREIEIWANLFPEVRIASPLRNGEPPKDCLPFNQANISIIPQLETGGDDLRSKIVQFLLLPVHILKLCLAMVFADVIHVRCPGNLGLLGAILAPLFSSRCIAKYAGQWNGYEHEPASVRWQRAVLSSWWWRKGVVTVYGEWPSQPKQIVPFFTSMMSAEQVYRSKVVAAAKKLDSPLQVIYSGRLVPLKAVDLVLRALAHAAEKGLQFEFVIVGGGPEEENLRLLARELGIGEKVRFVGAVPFSEVMLWYYRAHVLVLASNHSEGWPKVIAEAMCHGLVCIGSRHGLLPWMLRNRGATFEVGDVNGLSAALIEVSADPDRYQVLSQNAAAWAQGYSLEGLQSALHRLISRSWNIEVLGGPSSGQPSASEAL